MNAHFEHLGYSEEYYIDGKYIGSHKISQLDRPLGYAGRQYYVADNIIYLTNGMNKQKTIKKGSRYYTEVIELCGKLLNTHEEKIELFRRSKEWKIG